MPNIIVNNYCNQKCSYCFANANMNKPELQKNMSLLTYLEILKYLKINNDNNVRILGGEPLLFPHIRKFLEIANKGGFQTIIFSNINIKNQTLIKTFSQLSNTRINCNINTKSFYTESELINIEENITTLRDLNIEITLGFNIANLIDSPDIIVELAKKFQIKNVNLKITNSSLGENLIIDNSQRKLGEFIYNFIQKNHTLFSIEISCGLDKSIFLDNELEFIKKQAGVHLVYGCEGNVGKLDINTDGSIFKCYPLESLFQKKKVFISELLDDKTQLSEVINTFHKANTCNGECVANKKIKNQT